MRWPIVSACAVAIILSFGAACADSKKAAQAPAQKTETVAQKVKDPICGMTVDPKTAEKATYEGKTYYFCSRDEKVEFEKNPAKYVAKK